MKMTKIFNTKYNMYISIENESKEIGFATIYMRQQERLRKSSNEAKEKERNRRFQNMPRYN